MKRQLSDASAAVLFRLERLQVELDSIAQQVAEVEAAVQARGGALRAAAVLEGLAQLAGNLGTIEAQSDAASVDHIESGRDEARALARQIRASGRALRERMERVRSELNNSSSGAPAPSGADADAEGEPQITRQGAVDATLLAPPRSASDHSAYLTPQPSLERMDTATSEASLLLYGGGNGEAAVAATALPSDTALYSWGRMDLGALFQDAPGPDGGGAPLAATPSTDECPALLRAARSTYSKKNFAAVSSTLYHTVAVTTTGEVYGAGVNEDGQVAPERPEAQLGAPALVEALLSQRVLQVSCGDSHTACLTASGSVVTFGGNEVGQLGHSQGAAAATRVGPRTMLGLGGKIVKQVVCGSYFTVALSACGAVFSTGVGECGGHADGANRFQAERISKLRFVPVAFLAAGPSHVVAVSVTGRAWAWGQNGQGQAGVPDKEVVQEPVRVPGLPESGVRSAACGSFHSLFLTFGGDVYACGKNHRGQLGLPPPGADGDGVGAAEGSGSSSNYRAPVLVPQLSGVGVSMLACGDAHTLALTREGRVLAMGANVCGQLGDGQRGGWRWQAAEVQGLEGARVFIVAAGGEQSFALGLGPSLPAPSPIPAAASAAGHALPGGGGNGGGLGPIRRGASTMLDEVTLDLIRKFSVVKPATSFVSAPALLATVEAAARAQQEGAGGAGTEQLERTLYDLFSSASLVNGSFLHPQRASGLDVLGLEAVYVAVMKLGAPGLLQRLVAAFNAGLDALLPNVKELGQADSLRCLLVYWQCPLNSNTALSKEPFLKLCDAVVRLPPEARDRLIALARSDYPPHIFATRLLRPLHKHLAYHLTVDFGKGRAVPTLAVVMSFFFAANEGAEAGQEGVAVGTTRAVPAGAGAGAGAAGPAAGPLIPRDQFANEAVSSLPDESLLYDLRNWKTRRGENIFTFCSFPFLLSAEAKRRLLNSEAQLEQQQAAQQDIMRQLFQGGLVMPFSVIRVERAQLVQSALAQIGALDGVALKKQLKIKFVGEEGVDEGGVKKEFFQLLIAQLFDPCYGMFKPTDSRRDLWFNPSCTWSAEEYRLVGVLVGLAIYNATLLDLHFPRVVYKKLLDQPVGLADLQDVEPELMKGLQKLLAYDEAAPENGGASVADVFCLTFEVDWVEFDEVRRHELKEGGKEVDVTAANRGEYADLYVKWVLDGSIAAQFEEFKAGFNRVMGGSSISLLRPEELELLVCGTPHLNFHELEEVARYEGGYDAKHAVVRWFWETVHEMDLESQRKLLMFVTGSFKAPIGGLGKLSLLIQRAGPDADSLPTSHTCFNTLLLPEYASKEKLRERLMRAINECQGFGLQ